MKKAWISLLLVASIVGIVGFYFQKKEAVVPEHVHYHAGFKVFIDGQEQDYSDFQYMSLVPCSTEKQKLTPEELQLEKAHLHDQVDDVAHVHRAGAHWKDLFQNLGVEFEKGKEVVAYSADGVIPDILNTEIQSYQSIVIVVGSQEKAEEYRKNIVTRQHIEETEGRSELCGS